MMRYNADEVLKYMLKNDMVNMSYMQEQINMSKRDELLSKHPYKIWKGSDGNWHTYLPDDTKGRIHRKRASKDDLEQEIVSFWEEHVENPTLEEVFTEWNDRRLTLKKISAATHLRLQQIFNRHFDEFKKERIKQISSEEISNFLEEQIPRFNLTAKAFSNLKSLTKGMMKRAKKRKLISFNVEELFQELDISDADFHKVIHEDYEEVFDEDETARIVAHLEENLDTLNLGILLMFVSGARIGEVVALKHSDFGSNSFNIRRTETRFINKEGEYVCEVKEYPKTAAGVRTVALPDSYQWIVGAIRRQNPFGEFIFMNGEKRISTQSMRMRLKRLCRKLHIYHKSPHKIRKTYGTILMDNHIDKRLIMDQMGHTDISCSEKHYHRNRRSIDKKASIISGIPEFSAKQNGHQPTHHMPVDTHFDNHDAQEPQKPRKNVT